MLGAAHDKSIHRQDSGMQLCRLAVAQVVMRGSLLNSTQCPGGQKNALMFCARTGTAHELTRHASEYWNQRLVRWGNHSLAQPVGGQQSLPKDVLCSIQYNSGLLGTQRPVTLSVKSLTGNNRLHNHLRRPIWGRAWRCGEPS